MEKFNRAVRRHHAARLKRKRARYWGGAPKEVTGAQQARYLGLLLNTATPCSCWMCGNPRRHRKDVSLAEYVAVKINLCLCGLPNKLP